MVGKKEVSARFTLKGKKIYIHGGEKALEKPQKKAIFLFIYELCNILY